jgi:two-component system cell cycle response regulator CpdR
MADVSVTHTQLLGFHTSRERTCKIVVNTSTIRWHRPCSIVLQNLWQRRAYDNGVTTYRRILVVDDEPWSLEFISRFLRKEGYEVTEASDGAEAVELIKNSRFDLVLSDVRMPRLDGVALAMHIRSRVPTIPIILMTGVPFDLTEKLGYHPPCLSKPLSLDELRSNIQRALT